MTKCRAGFAIGRGVTTATFLANCLEISLGAGIYFLKRIFIDCSTEILRDKLPGLLHCGRRKRGHAKRVQAYQNSCVVGGLPCNRFDLPEKFHVSFNTI